VKRSKGEEGSEKGGAGEEKELKRLKGEEERERGPRKEVQVKRKN
jgi:hypothetical protein